MRAPWQRPSIIWTPTQSLAFSGGEIRSPRKGAGAIKDETARLEKLKDSKVTEEKKKQFEQWK
eukprot:gene15296-16048_t